MLTFFPRKARNNCKHKMYGGSTLRSAARGVSRSMYTDRPVNLSRVGTKTGGPFSLSLSLSLSLSRRQKGKDISLPPTVCYVSRLLLFGNELSETDKRDGVCHCHVACNPQDECLFYNNKLWGISLPIPLLFSVDVLDGTFSDCLS